MWQQQPANGRISRWSWSHISSLKHSSLYTGDRWRQQTPPAFPLRMLYCIQPRFHDIRLPDKTSHTHSPPSAGFFIALEPGRHVLPRELKKTRIFRQLSLTLLDIEKLLQNCILFLYFLCLYISSRVFINTLAEFFWGAILKLNCRLRIIQKLKINIKSNTQRLFSLYLIQIYFF